MWLGFDSWDQCHTWVEFISKRLYREGNHITAYADNPTKNLQNSYIGARFQSHWLSVRISFKSEFLRFSMRLLKLLQSLLEFLQVLFKHFYPRYIHKIM